MNTFKVGDTVRQITESGRDEHNFPYSHYPTLTVTGVHLDCVGFAEDKFKDGEANHMYQRFVLTNTGVRTEVREGDILRNTSERSYYTLGENYEVHEDSEGLYLLDDDGDERYALFEGYEYEQYFTRLETLSANPKDAIGRDKPSVSALPMLVVQELGLAMAEGERKYGRHNYRFAPVSATVYFDAFQRHIIAWWEGQDTDPDSGLNHVTKAMACLAILRDAEINETLIDDRPLVSKNRDDFLAGLQGKMDAIVAMHPVAVAPYTQKPQKKVS